ncbi:hypothetical protein OH77DRAFT_645578 [Trametes cingulata]|nr:hypothetical protein OH77DRAFT_645578 [Trametes cingulata]
MIMTPLGGLSAGVVPRERPVAARVRQHERRRRREDDTCTAHVQRLREGPAAGPSRNSKRLYRHWGLTLASGSASSPEIKTSISLQSSVSWLEGTQHGYRAVSPPGGVGHNHQYISGKSGPLESSHTSTPARAAARDPTVSALRLDVLDRDKPISHVRTIAASRSNCSPDVGRQEETLPSRVPARSSGTRTRFRPGERKG